MIAFDLIMRPRLKHRGEEVKAVREKHQRPKVRDVGNKWKLTYRDYSYGEPQRRSKVWAKSKVRSQREAQRLADVFMEEVNERNNQQSGSASTTETSKDGNATGSAEQDSRITLAQLKDRCMELSWPLLKKSTRGNYEFFFSSYLVPAFGDRRIDELSTMEFQAFFNSLLEKLSPYTICNMHAALRAALGQAKIWNLADRNVAIGVKLPKKKPSKPTQLLTFQQIKVVIEHLPEPTRTIPDRDDKSLPHLAVAGGLGGALRFQVAIHRVQHLAAQIVLFKQVAEAEDRGFIWSGGDAQRCLLSGRP